MGFLCFRYSDATVNERRTAKYKAVDLFMKLARMYPKSAKGTEGIPDNKVAQAAILVSEFWGALDPAARTTLANGKGCNTRPPQAQNYTDVTTLRDFLKKGAEHPYRHKVLPNGNEIMDCEGVTCWGGYIADGYEWAKQVMTESPKAFSGSIQLDEYVNYVEEAELDQDLIARHVLEMYKAQPAWPPGDQRQCVFYGPWLAGECFQQHEGLVTAYDSGLKYKKTGLQYLVNGVPKDGLNKMRSQFNAQIRKLDKDLSQYVIQILQYEFDDCFDRWVKWYHLKEIALDENIDKDGTV